MKISGKNLNVPCSTEFIPENFLNTCPPINSNVACSIAFIPENALKVTLFIIQSKLIHSNIFLMPENLKISGKNLKDVVDIMLLVADIAVARSDLLTADKVPVPLFVKVNTVPFIVFDSLNVLTLLGIT